MLLHSFGGATANGTAFEPAPDGAPITLYNLTGGTDGANYSVGLTASNGTFCGTTEYGGTQSDSVAFGVTRT